MIVFILKYWKFIAGALLVLACIAWFRAEVSHADERGYNRAMSEVNAQRLLAEREKAASEARARAISEAQDRAYQVRTQELQNKVNSLLSRHEPIRLCKSAPNSEAGIPEAATVAHESPADSGHGVQAGDDIGAKLLVYAAEAEGYRQQVIALQDWISAQEASWNESPSYIRQ